MNGYGVCTLLVISILTALLSGCVSAEESSTQSVRESTNAELVQSAFNRWRAATGGPFELLDNDATWTISGASQVSKTYASKERFMAEVIRPFNARMQSPLRPTVRNLYSSGDTVIVLFDAESVCIDGIPYRNTYAWFMEMKDGRAINVTAFFDTRLFDEMWSRVQPL